MKLLDYIISVANKSGSIPPSPNALKNLKGSIEGVPFGLLTPSMSGLFTQANMMQGIQILLKQMGNLNNIGNFQQILSQFQNGSVTAQQLLDALGNAGAMSAVMMSSLPASVSDQTTTLNTTASLEGPQGARGQAGKDGQDGAPGKTIFVNDMELDAGTVLFDPDTGQFWLNNTTHTTITSGTFSDERAANPSYWEVVQFEANNVVYDTGTVQDALDALSIEANTTQIIQALGGNYIEPDNLWSVVSPADLGNVSDTVTLDFNTALNFKMTLTGNVTLANPSNLKTGQSFGLYIVQDATGGRTVSYGTQWLPIGVTNPVFYTTASKKNYISGQRLDANTIVFYGGKVGS